MKDYDKTINNLVKLEERWKPSGCIAIALDGQTIYKKALGYADIAAGRKTQLTDSYCMALLSPILSLLMLMLMDDGKLKLTDKISKYIPEYKYGEKITINNLLRRRSGIVNYFTDIVVAGLDKDDAYRASDPQHRFVSERLMNAKGYTFKKYFAWLATEGWNTSPAAKTRTTTGTPTQRLLS